MDQRELQKDGVCNDKFPPADLLSQYEHVPEINRDRLHYQILKNQPKITAIVFLQHMLQRFSGCCLVSELAAALKCGVGEVYHIALILNRDMWIDVIIKSLPDCTGTLSLKQDSVDTLTLTHPNNSLLPSRSVHAAENMWRDALQCSHQKPLGADEVWLHWESINPRYPDWWIRQVIA